MPGCSTGEEAYSPTIVLKEAVEEIKPKKQFTIQVFATDLDRDAIDKARHGVFPANIAADVSPERLRRFFDKDDHGYRVHKEIREMVIFAPQNIIMDPPFTKLALISCRNLLIYLMPELQKKLFPLSPQPQSRRFVTGSAETLAMALTFLHRSAANRGFPADGIRPATGQVVFPSSLTRSAHCTRGTSAPKPPVGLSPGGSVGSARYPPAVLCGDIHVSGRTQIQTGRLQRAWNLLPWPAKARPRTADVFRKRLKKGSVALTDSL